MKKTYGSTFKRIYLNKALNSVFRKHHVQNNKYTVFTYSFKENTLKLGFQIVNYLLFRIQ